MTTDQPKPTYASRPPSAMLVTLCRSSGARDAFRVAAGIEKAIAGGMSYDDAISSIRKWQPSLFYGGSEPPNPPRIATGFDDEDFAPRGLYVKREDRRKQR